ARRTDRLLAPRGRPRGHRRRDPGAAPSSGANGPRVSDPAALRCRGLRHAFGPVRAVDGVSFTVRPGEVFGLLGPNGAGKTTTLRVLCTLLKPTAGSARVAGFDVVTQADQVRRSIGFVSAGTGIYDRMTAQEF